MPGGELVHRRGECRRERLRLRGQADEQEALPLGQLGTDERVIVAIEALDLLHGGGDAEPPVQAVGPGMVGAPDRIGEPALRLRAEPRPPVPTDVEEGPGQAITAPDDEEALADDLGDVIGAGVGDQLGPAEAEPVAGEDPLHLLAEDHLVGVVTPGEGAGPAADRGPAVIARRLPHGEISRTPSANPRWRSLDRLLGSRD